MLYVTCSGEDDRPEIVRIAPGRRRRRTLEHRGAALSERVPRDAGRRRARRRGGEGRAGGPRADPCRRLGREPRDDRRRSPTPTPTGSRSPPTGSYWVTLYRPDGLVRIAPDGTDGTVVDDHLASTLDAPTNIAWVGADLDRVVVSNVGGTIAVDRRRRRGRSSAPLPGGAVMARFTDRNVIVTGGAQGIGRGIVRGVPRRGRSRVRGRHPRRRAPADPRRWHPDRVATHPVDLADFDAAKAMARAAIDATSVASTRW